MKAILLLAAIGLTATIVSAQRPTCAVTMQRPNWKFDPMYVTKMECAEANEVLARGLGFYRHDIGDFTCKRLYAPDGAGGSINCTSKEHLKSLSAGWRTIAPSR